MENKENSTEMKSIQCLCEYLLDWLETEVNKVKEQRKLFEDAGKETAWWRYEGIIEGLESVSDHIDKIGSQLLLSDKEYNKFQFYMQKVSK